MELLCLVACLHFEVQKGAFLFTPAPGLEGEQRCRAMIGVRIHRPVRENDVRLLSVEQRRKGPISRGIDFRRSIDLVREDRLRSQEFAGFQRFFGADSRSLFVRLALNAGLSACQIDNRYVMSRCCVPGQSCTTA